MPQFRSIGHMMSATFGGGRGGSSNSSLPSYLQNFKSSNTANIKRALTNPTNGSNSKGICFGDSLTAGQGADGTATGLRSQSYPSQLAADLASNLSIDVNIQDFFGSTNLTSTSYPVYDPRLTMGGASWSTTLNSVGGPVLTAANDTSTPTFTPLEQFDTIDYYLIDRGSSVDLTADGEKFTVTTTSTVGNLLKGTHAFSGLKTSLVMQAEAAAGESVIGIHCYNSANPCLLLQNQGWRGSTVGQWTPNPSPNQYDPYKVIVAETPDFVIMNIGTNDMSLGTTLSDFELRYTRIISQIKSDTVDVIVLIPAYNASSDVDGASGHATLDTINSFMDSMRSISITADCPYVDTPQLTGSYAEAHAAGIMFDITHLNGTGYGIQAGGIRDGLIATLTL